MIGYKCNACGNKIAESKYNYLKEKNELRCEMCRSGFYTPYFEDENSKDDDLLNFSTMDTNINSGIERQNRSGKFSDQVKELVKKGDKLPGATTPNRFIGAGIVSVLATIITPGNWWPLEAIAFIGGAVLGWLFAPYFVPVIRKWIKKLWDKITKKDDGYK